MRCFLCGGFNFQEGNESQPIYCSVAEKEWMALEAFIGFVVLSGLFGCGFASLSIMELLFGRSNLALRIHTCGRKPITFCTFCVRVTNWASPTMRPAHSPNPNLC